MGLFSASLSWDVKTLKDTLQLNVDTHGLGARCWGRVLPSCAYAYAGGENLFARPCKTSPKKRVSDARSHPSSTMLGVKASRHESYGYQSWGCNALVLLGDPSLWSSVLLQEISSLAWWFSWEIRVSDMFGDRGSIRPVMVATTFSIKIYWLLF
ncbi:hypothetical protein GOP47_0012676 [Adiantum capillus-veneris]|uniref:Uncharacterized protein n=1 Tax=Adiantum capillus-veneris TaxID=13818 RepID=A0A9D4UR49_ADICA|nr:hypothetical protein GOP47_0012676 [Adiantum capillus-veneris]